MTTPQITRERWEDAEALLLRDKLVEAIETHAVNPAEMAERLGSAFDWRASPQGWQFWRHVTQALYALAASHSDQTPADRR